MYKNFIVTIILVIIFILFIYYFVILQRKSFLTPQLPVLINEEELTSSSKIMISTQSPDSLLKTPHITSTASETELLKTTSSYTTSSF